MCNPRNLKLKQPNIIQPSFIYFFIFLPWHVKMSSMKKSFRFHPLIPLFTSASCSGYDTAASHSWQCLWFHQVHFRIVPEICSTENTRLVFIWRKLHRYVQSRSSQVGSQPQKQRILSVFIRKHPVQPLDHLSHKTEKINNLTMLPTYTW